MTNYFLVADKILQKLAREFDVPSPDLLQTCSGEHLAGWYAIDTVHLGVDTLKNLHHTVLTTRHEFAHYLQELLSLPDSEIKAKKFERNIFALGVLPKSQKLIINWMVCR